MSRGDLLAKENHFILTSMTSSLSCGILGLPNVGKSTLFNALTRQSAPASNYPFCTIEPNLGLVEIPDARLKVLAELSKSRQIVPAAMRFWDIAGLVQGASQGEGLGNQFLGHIRQVDALVHVVRCFEDGEITHIAENIDALRDVELIQTELLLADLQVVEGALDRVIKQRKATPQNVASESCLKKLRDHLNQNAPARTVTLDEEEGIAAQSLNLLTAKPMIYLANIAESDLASPEDNGQVARLKIFAEKEGAELLCLCADLEAQIATLDPLDRTEMLAAVGLKSSGLERLIKTSFDTLGLIAFLTTGEMETRAWTIQQGTSAQRAAGKIHSDLERGFIRAEVIAFDHFKSAGSRQRAKELGQLRTESRDYIVQDGDVILFLHR